MDTLGSVAKYIRSKAAGPFWLTIDIFCDSDEDYEKVANSPNVSRETFAGIYQIPADGIKMFYLPNIRVVKISFPRKTPQGSPNEYDMHSGQQYIPIRDVAL